MNRHATSSAYLAIDQGTTSSRAILFNHQFEILYTAQREFPQYYPKNGWVEQDPEELWLSVLNVAREALTVASDLKLSVKHVGITNQRETTLVWNKESGLPVYNAIVWQDRRTSGYCSSLSVHENLVQQKTGLKLDPYFSASKIRWILDNVQGAAELAANNKLLFGTVDTFLIWRLTNGNVHATDVTELSSSDASPIKGDVPGNPRRWTPLVAYRMSAKLTVEDAYSWASRIRTWTWYGPELRPAAVFSISKPALRTRK
ncbi:MAG: FGGY family carbohydrate kinase [Pseudomonadota bacterium]